MLFARHHDVALLKAKDNKPFYDNELALAQDRPKRYRPTYATISLLALEHNIKVLRDLISPSLIAVSVKANAYGHGILEIAKQLEALSVDMLCVATGDEALMLRDKGIKTPILLLSEPQLDAIGPCYINDITFSVYTKETINVLSAYASSERQAHVHVKVDTGMNRVGVNPQEALDLVRYIAKDDSLHLEGVFTHFANADDVRDFGTSKQLAIFEEVLDDIEIAGLTPPIIHSANSAAAISVPSSRFNMCRLGIAAYGIYPEPRCADIINLKPVMSLETQVAFVKRINQGDYVSYGRSFESQSDTQIATLPIGYGDGVPRNLGNVGGSVLINGVKCPIVGNVTMDQMMVDVGDSIVNRGDRVVLWGQDSNRELSPVQWADLTSTISYEILCSISERVERIYD